METKDVIIMLFEMLKLEINNEMFFNSDNIIIKTQNNEKIQIDLQKE